jgi:hypothetical protein
MELGMLIKYYNAMQCCCDKVTYKMHEGLKAGCWELLGRIQDILKEHRSLELKLTE